MNILSLSDVAKAFGQVRVLQGLTFDVPEHTIFGFIGPNGAGKTTTMKLILGLLRPDHGTITVGGLPVTYGQNRTNRMIGYLPDVPEFYGFLTPAEYLRLCGEITGMDRQAVRRRSDELLSLVGLPPDRRIRGFSRGMKQRLGIAQALLHEPKLLICDEPTSALDPSGRKELLDILHTVRDHTTVLFSTHILSDVERVCDEIVLLHDGKAALHGTLSEIRAMHGSSGFEIEFLRQEDTARFEALLPGGSRTDRLTLRYPSAPDTALQLLAREHIPVRRMEQLEPTLEALFMEVTEK